MASYWMVRAGRESESIEDFVEKCVVGMGGKELGKLTPSMTKDELVHLYEQKHPGTKNGTATHWASQYIRFMSEIKVGDKVVTFDRNQRRYLIGTVTSEYEWAPQVVDDKPHVRRVTWSHQVSRDVLGSATKYSLGAIQTLFKLNPDVKAEFETNQTPMGSPAADKPPVSQKVPLETPAEAEADEEIRLDTLEKADVFIEDAINRLSWQQMQDLVAGLLRSMGYRTVVAANGPDRGVDIFASPDGLGLQEPRIFVEVKHRRGAMGSKEIRAFLGGRTEKDRCLYVSTGGFSKEALYEADRAKTPLTLINLPYLRRLLVERYEELDPETAALVPLKKYYWPVN